MYSHMDDFIGEKTICSSPAFPRACTPLDTYTATLIISHTYIYNEMGALDYLQWDVNGTN